jgi:DNA-binding response OmpR family regulator
MSSPSERQKLVLIADPDRDTVRLLGNALHEQGYQVKAAVDGSKALEKTILSRPDIILFDERCPLIPLQKFIQILRSNPRTEDIPLIAMVERPADELTGRGYREAYIQKPFNTDELLSLVAATLNKMATAEQVRAQAREIEGSLSQISLFDLIQIFHLNRKTGVLELRDQEQTARIYLREGTAVHALVGRHSGEKAFFRLLGWRRGSFAFIPGQSCAEISLRRNTDLLLLEGARQGDELARLLQQLPGEQRQLRLVPARAEQFEGLHPVTQEMLNLIEFYNTAPALIEHSRASDYEGARAILTLMEKGIVEVVEAPAAAAIGQAALLQPDLLYELKVKVAGRLRLGERQTRGKILILSATAEALEKLLAAVKKFSETELDSDKSALRNGFGRLGVLRLSDNFILDLMLLPIEPPLRPLWAPLGVYAVGALLLARADDEQAVYRSDVLGGLVGEFLKVPVESLLLPHPGAENADAPAEAFRDKLVTLLSASAGGPEKN